MEITIGCELEGGLVDSRGRPVDTLAVLAGGMKSPDIPFEEITSDMGKASVELISAVSRSGSEVLASFERSLGRIPLGHYALFETCPFGTEVELVDKSRCRAMMDALAREHPEGRRGVPAVAPWCSTQFHLGFGNAFGPAQVLLLNVLNNIAPYARMRVIERFKVKGAQRHLSIWQGWCDARRVPAPRWFKDLDELHAVVRGIPKLLTLRNGEWVHADEEPSRLGDSESEGTLWWLARPRLVYNTVEWRPFPSLMPEDAALLADRVLALARDFSAYVRENERATAYTMREIRSLFRHLAHHELMPSEPLCETEWWKLYEQ